MTAANIEIHRDHILIVIPQPDGTEVAYAVRDDRSAAYQMLRRAGEAAAQSVALAPASAHASAHVQTIREDDPTPIDPVDTEAGAPSTWVEAAVNLGRDAHAYVKATPEAEQQVRRGLDFLRSASSGPRRKRRP